MPTITAEELAFWKHNVITKAMIKFIETVKENSEELILNFPSVLSSENSDNTLLYLGKLHGFKDAIDQILENIKEPELETLNNAIQFEEKENELDKD